MKHLDLFSGIGGFSLAASWAGHTTIGFSEIDTYASAVLKKNFPSVPNFGDIKQLTSLPVYDIIRLCHVLKTLSTTTHPASMLKECPSRLLPSSTESLDRLCIKYSFVEVLYSALISESAMKIASTEEALGRTIMPTMLLNTLSERALSNAEQLVIGAEPLRCLRTAEQEYKRTIPTITSLLKLCGYVRSVITNGISTTPLLKGFNYENTIEERIDLLTAGVPCQPSSVAGKRKGSKDDRWLWPATLEVVRVYKPRWVILENVGGFITIDDGMALESTCTFLETEGYEVQPIIIPACAVGAPHRRDRVWIVAHAEHPRRDSTQECGGIGKGTDSHSTRAYPAEQPAGCGRPTTAAYPHEQRPHEQADFKVLAGAGRYQHELSQPRDMGEVATDTSSEGLQRHEPSPRNATPHTANWIQDWYEAATSLCRVDDGLPNRVDRLKCLGNAIVPQVAYEILKLMK